MATKRPRPEPEPKLPKACPPPHELRDVFVRDWLLDRFAAQNDQFKAINARIRALETKVSKLGDKLAKLEASADKAIAEVQSDVQGLRDKIAELEASAADGNISDEDQATLDRLTAKLDALDPVSDATVDDVPPAPEDTGEVTP